MCDLNCSIVAGQEYGTERDSCRVIEFRDLQRDLQRDRCVARRIYTSDIKSADLLDDINFSSDTYFGILENVSSLDAIGEGIYGSEGRFAGSKDERTMTRTVPGENSIRKAIEMSAETKIKVISSIDTASRRAASRRRSLSLTSFSVTLLSRATARSFRRRGRSCRRGGAENETVTPLARTIFLPTSTFRTAREKASLISPFAGFSDLFSYFHEPLCREALI